MDDLDSVAIGQAIQRVRESKRWTTYRLAKYAGMSDPYLRDIEAGKSKRVGLGVVVRVAHALGTTTDDLLRDAGVLPRGTVRPFVPSELSSVYSDLDDIQRRALLQIGHALREAQEAYETRDIGRLASFSGATQEEQEQAKRDALDSGEHPD